MKTINDAFGDRDRCKRGHSLDADSPNLYLYQDKDGNIHRHCRTCRSIRMGTVTSRDISINRSIKNYRPSGPVNRKN